MTEQTHHNNVPCPFCGLVCDDLAVAAGGSASPPSNCARATAGFAVGRSARPHLEGTPVSYSEALAAAVDRLRGRSPVMAGMSTDVAGARAALAFADRTGGTVTHMNQNGLAANGAVVRDHGWIATTFSEVRNRADRVVLLGGAVLERFPRLAERLLVPERRYGGGPRRVLLLGDDETAPPVGVETVACDEGRLAELAGALRTLAAGLPLAAERVAGVDREGLAALLETLQTAAYGVVVWDGTAMAGPQPTLAVQAWAELVDELNRQTRWSVLPVAGTDGDLTVNQVAVWQTGYALPVCFAAGYPQPAGTADEAGVWVWVASLDPFRGPPPHAEVVLGHPDMTPPQSGVFFPVGVPGVDHRGLLFRGDAVATLPLRRVRENGLPSAAQVIREIDTRLNQEERC